MCNTLITWSQEPGSTVDVESVGVVDHVSIVDVCVGILIAALIM